MNRLPAFIETQLYIPSMFATSCSRMTTHAFDLQYVIALITQKELCFIKQSSSNKL